MWSVKRKKDRTPEKRTPHHYVLAHVALRQAAFSDPHRFFTVMASPERQAFLDHLWRKVCERCDKEGAASFTADDVIVHTTRIDDYPTVLIEMPEPGAVAEAHLVCAVLMVPMKGASTESGEPELRYFTLEKGRRIATGQEATVLCGWQGGSHVNYGYGCQADPAAFLDRVRDLI